MRNSLILCYLIITLYRVWAIPVDSSSSVKEWKGAITLSTYIEAYYQYDFNQPPLGNRPNFVYSFHRNNIPSINLGIVKLSYSACRFRAHAAVMGGTYSVANLANEPVYLRNIYEANFGFRLLKKKELWFDAGVLPSHIGFESAIGQDCPTLTRSMLADNSPYFETGARISYTSNNQKILVSVLILNGWQRIQWIKGNSLPSFGWQVQGKLSEKLLLNSSAFAGTDKPDKDRSMRYFHNFYVNYSPLKTLQFTAGFDFGAEQNSTAIKTYNYWFSPVFIARYKPVEPLAVAARIEYYSDINGVIISPVQPVKFKTMGYSMNLDAITKPGIVLRIEGKLLQSISGAYFEHKNGNLSAWSPSVVASFSYYFAHTFNR